jgi:hypothetical protein
VNKNIPTHRLSASFQIVRQQTLRQAVFSSLERSASEEVEEESLQMRNQKRLRETAENKIQ